MLGCVVLCPAEQSRVSRGHAVTCAGRVRKRALSSVTLGRAALGVTRLTDVCRGVLLGP